MEYYSPRLMLMPPCGSTGGLVSSVPPRLSTSR
nr:MAG TPA: hypothetical protein [Caudoviricetes sp.]